MRIEIKSQLAKFISQPLSLEFHQVRSLLESPKKKEHGHLSLPVFFLAKERKKAPPKIAQDVVEALMEVGLPSWLESVSFVSGFVNFRFSTEYLQNQLLEMVNDDRGLGYSSLGQGKKVTLDFSSPNVAKPMHVGHLRATVIGQALYNLGKTQGYEMVGINHLGDWGVQYGRLAWAFKEWGGQYTSETIPFEELYALYVKFHTEMESRPELEALGSEEFKKLEQGDEDSLKLWKDFVEASLLEYNKIWEMLGVKHDLVRGESFYNDRLKDVEDELEKKGLLVESDGAQIVDLEDEGMPPCLIRKSDGASLYATRDLASALYRTQDLKADFNLYVVGAEQTLHFSQVFKVLEKMGYEWSDNCVHVGFGLYRFKDKSKFSSRKGNVITLKGVLDKSIEKIEELIEEKNPGWEHKEKVSKQVGIGAIIFNDLVNDRVKDVDFDWDKALTFEGDSGPYVQYTQVRCRSLMRKYGKEMPQVFLEELNGEAEKELLVSLLAYPEVLTQAYKSYKPHVLASYLLSVCKSFSHFYHSCRVLQSEEGLIESRILLVSLTQKVIEAGLNVLSIEAPEYM